MEVLWGADARPSDARPTVATVGIFDGVHRGHRTVFERVFEAARALGARSAVVTFDPHPLDVLAPEKAPCMLTTLDQRLGLFEEIGFDITLVLPFNTELSLLTPEEFAEQALVEELHVRKILVGADFRFGHDRAGDISTLREIGARDGFEADAVELVQNGAKRISSTLIRKRLSEGDVEAAADLLGRSWRLAGEVVEGDHRGRGLGFPTANMRPHPRTCLPGLGVYAGWWRWQGDRRPAAINVGVRPTFKEHDAPLCEVYVLDFDGDLYGERAEVEFTKFLRAEAKFDSVDALVAQMHADVARVRTITR